MGWCILLLFHQLSGLFRLPPGRFSSDCHLRDRFQQVHGPRKRHPRRQSHQPLQQLGRQTPGLQP